MKTEWVGNIPPLLFQTLESIWRNTMNKLLEIREEEVAEETEAEVETPAEEETEEKAEQKA